MADRAARFSPPPSPRGNFGEKKAARAARFGPPPGPSPFEARLAERAARFSPPPSPRAGDAGPPPRRRGVCQWFDPERKHGFIKPDGASADLFVHQMDLRAGTEITQGDAVEFGTADYNGRDKAVDVTKVERQFSHDGPAGRGRGGFGDARSAAAPGDGGGHRGPAPPHALPRSVQRPPRGFGPTRLSEAMSRRLRPDALRALAELETGDADAVVQRLEEAGLTVRDPSGYVMKAVERVRRGGTAGWNGAVGRCATSGAQGHLARDCPSAARGAPPDSLASLPSPPSARSNNQVLGDWICGACGGDNFARRRECRRCGTPKSSGEHWETNYGFQVPRPTPPRRRSSSRSRSRSRERRGRRGRRS